MSFDKIFRVPGSSSHFNNLNLITLDSRSLNCFKNQKGKSFRNNAKLDTFVDSKMTVFQQQND